MFQCFAGSPFNVDDLWVRLVDHGHHTGGACKYIYRYSFIWYDEKSNPQVKRIISVFFYQTETEKILGTFNYYMRTSFHYFT